MGDVVAILTSEPRVGLILEVLSQHRVVIRLRSRGANVEETYHVKILGLIFRPATLDQNETLNHLRSSFWD